MLIGGWHWKAALFSSLCRSLLFLFVNLRAGWRAALGAMAAEFVYRAFAAGFFGGVTQAFRDVTPRWHATIAVPLLVIVTSHSIELLLHWARGTPKLGASIIASIIFTTISTLFNLHAMRRGVLVTGRDAGSLAADFRSMPKVVWTFLTDGPRLLFRRLATEKS